MNKQIFILLFLLIGLFAQAQYKKEIKPVKNVILMIPDGTSVGVVSAARWYQIYNGGSPNLFIDEHLCGTVKTFSVNAPIGDSAPTTSCYMTGIPARPGNVSIYPLVDPVNDLLALDSTQTYQPLVTILEAAKLQQNKATGLVVTCEFPHATPADCAAHYYDRDAYPVLASQMVYNNLDVMIGGGNKVLTDDMKVHLQKTNTALIQNDIEAFRSFDGNQKLWALFGNMDIPYDWDRDTSLYPSLAETTQKAITRLSKNDNGFFLMVEGSKVDWAAHANDAVACITEYLAFDKAVGVAMDFAKKDGETLVIILPDHGNSGFSIGRRGGKKYTELTISDLFENVSKYNKTGYGLTQIIKTASKDEIRPLFKKYTDIELNENEIKEILSAEDFKGSYMEVSNGKNLESVIVDIMNSKTYFGFTSGGHTGEEVLLAAYHPAGEAHLPIGLNTNVEINQYLFSALGLQKSLKQTTTEIFSKHQDVFKGLNYKIETKSIFPELVVKNKKKQLVVPANKSVVFLNRKEISLNSVIVYIDKNGTFYLPESLRGLLE